jgi:WD40 repeat protein
VADVFVSYSRRDGEFVGRLAADLKARGREAWIDVNGIRDAERFPEALSRAIESSDAFVFVISPDSVASEFCEQEVQHASSLNKRIVPLALHEVPDERIPDEIRYRNWIPVGASTGVDRVIAAIDTDPAWEHQHTRLTVKALEWDAAEREGSFLLRGADLAAAEQWLAKGAGKEPGPTELEQEYVFAGRAAAARRQRTLVGASLVVAAVAIGLLVFALISRSQAISARDTAKAEASRAKSQALAAESQNQLSVDPERAVLLGVAALRTDTTPAATLALRAGLDASSIRYRVPGAVFQQCGSQGFGQAQEAPGVAYSRDGRQLAVGRCDGTVTIADASNGRAIRTVDVGSPAGQVAYNQNGSRLGAIGGGRIVVIDPRTGAVLARGPHVSGTTRLAFSPVAPVLASARGDSIVLWNLHTGTSSVLPISSRFGERPGGGLAFSPDGRRLAVTLLFSYNTGVRPGPQVLLLDTRSDRVVATNDTPAADVSFSPDGHELAVSSGTPVLSSRTIFVLDARTLRSRRVFGAPLGGAASIAFSPDGRELGYGSSDGHAAVISAGTGRLLLMYAGSTGDVGQVAFAPDGRLLATASQDGTVRAWGTRAQFYPTGVSVPPASVLAIPLVQPVPSGFEIASVAPSGAAELRRWSDRGRALGPPLRLASTCNGCGVVLTPDGRVAGLVPGTPAAKVRIRFWDVAKRRPIDVAPLTPTPQAWFPAISPDGRTLAEAAFSARAGESFEFGLVDTRTGRFHRLLGTGCAGGFHPAFSPNGAMVGAASQCGTQIAAWSIRTGRRTMLPQLNGQASALAFSPDGRRVAVASQNGTVTVDDTTTGRVVSVLLGHDGAVDDVAWSPDGRYIASAGVDDTVRIWDAHTFSLARVLTHPDAVAAVAFTADSRDVVSYDNSGSVRIWDACTDCENRRALLALARTRVTRALTPTERRTFGVG